MNQPQLQGINVHALAQKCKSKKELYNFLTQDCQAFLPKIESTNIYFFKQIFRAQKDVSIIEHNSLLLQYLRRDQVKVSAVPQIEGLTVHDFLQFAKLNPQHLKYLPDERDWVHLDRQWICDVLYTLDPDEIQTKINSAQQNRKERLEQNRDLVVEMRPEFADALNRCLNFSTERGKSANLMKDSSKRKRKANEIREVVEEEKQLRNDKHTYLQEAKRLKDQQSNFQDELIVLKRDKDALMDLFEANNLGNQVEEFKF
ncbi:UNKNOWN [Stylonychia lemnae]|uniref:Uncharacterized protein n=1 Tax=Stylonychia lemnae TaxID=5949 RepID=A0A078AJA5_STYLE|nr:UNKNOWN [Stylonychia lemnae]CDW82388.1 UNKNOWN [Stylonychia lemnae]|eukprot:CDW82385.1 UNKNOWN [Stylonychia lemnae]